MRGPGDDHRETRSAAWRQYLVGLALIAILVGGINIINVISIVHDEPRAGVLAPAIWEGSSWLSIVLLAWIPWLALKRLPPSARPLWMLCAFHLAVAFVYSAAHVAGFVLMRKAVYALAGSDYRFGPVLPGFLYEASKDVFGYVVFVAIFWIAGRLTRPHATMPSAEALFDIRDGARIVRVRMNDILAVTSAGNYVEFVLRDGRRPLMRSPLSSMESELLPHGFLRTHRSWLVNANQVTGLQPEGSGDYALELGSLRVPLSRRFPKTLARLRGG
ncbi:MAG: response regulator transcription factor [Alphaproteobacteria bacterium]|nr:response regulator transcription factor [Alphaproteobacteria bacterium]